MSEQSQDGDDGWQFGVDDVDEDGIVADKPEPIEPESPDLEHVAFVVAGVLVTLAVLLGGI